MRTKVRAPFMTEKLFWTDPYQKEFTASLQEQFPVADGNALVLDRTCFYATSGGQPNDLGILNEAAVKDVRIEDGKLLHITQHPIDSKSVSGKIDWDRRFDHMQQHTGQHILSAAFFRLFKAETSSFHLGELFCSIELNKTELKELQALQAEDLANDVITSASPVSAFFMDPAKAQDYPLRKQSDLTESLRIIQIGDFDLSPCSGTHVRNTGEIGSVFVYAFEKLSGSVKVTFLCGNRVRRLYHQELSILKDASKKFTTSFDSIPESITRLQTQIKDLRRENMKLKEARLTVEAMELLNSPENKQIIRVWDRSFEEVRFIAQRLSEQPEVSGALVSKPERRCIFFKHPEVKTDLKPIFTRFLEMTNGRGGGPPHLMEAGNLNISNDIESVLNTLFTQR
jgi:alanyl-tRNA synthetase